MSDTFNAVALDLGSHRVRVLIAEMGSDGERRILGMGIVPSQGIRKGVVVSFEEAVDAILRAKEEAERAAGLEIQRVFAAVTGDHFRCIRSEGVHVKDGQSREISARDVEQVIRVAQGLQLPAGHRILHTLPRDFILDHQRGIRNPVGMDGVRLQAEVMLALGQTSILDNSAKAIAKAGLDLEGMVFSPLATGMSILDEDEREEGVVMLDIGAGTTEIIVMKADAVEYAEVLPLGGVNISRDLSIGLTISHTDAERLKRDNATLQIGEKPKTERMLIRQVGAEREKYVTAATLHEIVLPRVKEILELAWERARRSETARSQATSVVICGGTALLPGIADLAAQLFDRKVRVGKPRGGESLSAELLDPRFALSVGLLEYGRTRLGGGTGEEGFAGGRFRVGGLLKRWLKSMAKTGSQSVK